MSKIGISYIFGSITRIVKIFGKDMDMKRMRGSNEVMQDDIKSIASWRSKKDIVCIAYVNTMICYEIDPNGIKVI